MPSRAVPGLLPAPAHGEYQKCVCCLGAAAAVTVLGGSWGDTQSARVTSSPSSRLPEEWGCTSANGGFKREPGMHSPFPNVPWERFVAPQERGGGYASLAALVLTAALALAGCHGHRALVCAERRRKRDWGDLGDWGALARAGGAVGGSLARCVGADLGVDWEGREEAVCPVPAPGLCQGLCARTVAAVFCLVAPSLLCYPPSAPSGLYASSLPAIVRNFFFTVWAGDRF